MAFPFFNTISLSFFFFITVIIFSASVPSIHSLSTVAISENSDLTLICTLTQTDNHLNCSGFPAGTQASRLNSNISYSGIVGGDGFVCAFQSFSSSTSVMTCWRFSANGTNREYKRIYDGPVISDLVAGTNDYCSLENATNLLQCWPWHDFHKLTSGRNLTFSSIAVGDDFVCGLEIGRISCFPLGSNHNYSFLNQPIDGNYSSISAGVGQLCALTSLSNELHCWGSNITEPQGQFRSLALGENRACGLLANNGRVVCWGQMQNNFSLPQGLEDTEFINIEAKRNVFCGVVTGNFSLICWGDQNFDEYLQVFDNVLPVPCRSSCPCGVLPGLAGLCSQGSVCNQCDINNNTITRQPPPPLSDAPQPCSQPPCAKSGSGRWSDRMIAFLIVGCVGSSAFLLSIGFFLFKYCKCRGYRVHDSGPLDESGPPSGQGTQQPQQPPLNEQAPPVLEKRLSQLASMGNAGQLEDFSLHVLLQATNNFSEDHKVGTGSFGSVYRGILDDGREVAIKRAETSSTSSYAILTKRQEDKDYAFINELESLSRLNHKHLVRLLGFCEDRNERVLVYEFMSNGTLHEHLHKKQESPLMSWSARIKVALDAARGVEYLHEYAVPRIIHRDIKSSNILLDSSWIAKVSDFGLSLMGPDDEESHLSLRAAGTVGYMDPEYYRLQQLTTKSDVYSFGVVLLELLSGYKAIHKNENGVPRNVVDFVVPYIVQDEIHRVLDPKVPPPTPYEIEAVAYVGYLAADCVTLEGRDRPSMSEIVNSLERALAACLVHPASFSRSTTGSSA